jgi:hypothetical protein
MKKSGNGEEKATRQCWECLKRRLVCDHTLPHCKKCQKAGKDCPGYDEQKPLQWVQPGKVTSRRRKKDSLPKVYTAPPKNVTKCIAGEPVSGTEPPSTLCTVGAPERPSFDQDQWDEFFLGPVVEEPAPETSGRYDFIDPSKIAEVDRIFAFGGREKIEEVLEKGLSEQATQMVGPRRNPLKRLERVLRLMQTNDLPNYSYLSNETSDIVQAVNYCKY